MGEPDGLEKVHGGYLCIMERASRLVRKATLPGWISLFDAGRREVYASRLTEVAIKAWEDCGGDVHNAEPCSYETRLRHQVLRNNLAIAF